MDVNGRIALVEDNQTVRESLEGIFRYFKYQVTSFARGETFLKSSSFDFDFYIFDYRLSSYEGINGIDLLTSVRGQGIRSKVILTSGNFGRDALDRIKQEPNVAILVKPFRPADLLATMGVDANSLQPTSKRTSAIQKS